MQVRIEEQSSIAKRVIITVPVQQVAREFAGAYSRLGQRLNLPGFRKGKVPADVLKKRYGVQVSADVAQQLVDNGWKHVLQEHKLLPVTQPRLDARLEPARPDAEFTFSFTVEVPPEVDLLPYSTIAVEKTQWTLTETHVDHELGHVAERAATWEPVGDRDLTAKGDMVVVDFEGKLDNVPFEGGKAEEYQIVLGSGRLLPGFDDNLTGRKTGETFDFDVPFPEDYPKADLAGKQATFTCKINEIKTKVIPGIDDELAAAVGVENLEKLREEIRKQMAAHLEQTAKNEAFGRIQEHLAGVYKFELPPSLIEGELEERRKSMEQEISADAADRDERIKAGVEGARKNVEEGLRISFVLDAVATKESIEVEDAEVNREIELLARSSGFHGGRVRQMYREESRRAGLRRRIRHAKVLDFLLSKANVTVVEKEVPAHQHDDHEHDHED